MTPQSRTRKLACVAAEACGSLLLVLALFWLFLNFLDALFPSGTPLKKLMQGGSEQWQVNPGHRAEATLSSLLHDVRFRRGNSIAWGGANEGMELYNQDAVQTLDRSSANISFGKKDQLQLGSNSLMVVTRLNTDDSGGARSYRVHVDGELRGSLSAGRTVNMEFSAGGHLARIAGGEARFRIIPHGKKSASLAMYSGEAVVVAKGRLIRVPANFGVTLTSGAGVGGVVPLPAPPVPGGPEQRVYRYRLLPPPVGFAWSGTQPQYHFQVATEPGFRSLVIDEKIKSNGFVTGKLGEGNYYWRVSGVNDGIEGPFSRVGRCQMLQVLKTPGLQVSFPPENATPGAYTLTGTVEPGSKLFVDGDEVATAAPGEFSCELRLKPGVNLIRVEALDPTGNASYASRIVYGRNGEEQEPGRK